MRSGICCLFVVAAFADFADDKQAFEQGMKRPPLGKRVGTINRFARTKDPRAFELLMKRYKKPRIPKEQERYLIASAVGRSFSAEQFSLVRTRALGGFAQEEHAWLWYMLGRGANARPAKVKSGLLRAALADARAAAPREEDLDWIVRTIGSAPEDLDLRAAASVLHAHRARLGSEKFRLAALPVIAPLSDESVPANTKLVIARRLAAIFRVDQVSTHPLYWRQLLSHAERKQSAGPTVEARPRFFGVEATGDRIGFLLDLSDSMLEPLTPAERLDARRVAAEGIDWKKVRTRFDLAKVFLEQYLRALPKSVSFAVIGFGDEAVALKSGRKLHPATKGNVNAALREIGKIKPWGKDKLHPHGQLRGATNIHGAFRVAFRVTTGRSLRDPAFIDPAGWAKGFDTIFLLSDGRPTTDDFGANDEHKGGKVTVNPETGETRDSGGGSASFRGPYARSNHLAEDVERMNLFRKAEIHAIGMGSADRNLMRRLARSSFGLYRDFGVRARGGHLRYWRIVGPFDAGDQWAKPLPPEENDFDWRARFGQLRWTVKRGASKQGTVMLGGRKKNRATYACARFVPDEAGKATLRLGAESGVRVWLNGKMVIDALQPAEYERGAHVVEVTLVEGENLLLVKTLYEKGPHWRFHARIDGTPVRELEERYQ
ncbi:MAG: vWA domain-containing protein [Planctomycetota bacterium]|jgi:hypothetical protein